MGVIVDIAMSVIAETVTDQAALTVMRSSLGALEKMVYERDVLITTLQTRQGELTGRATAMWFENEVGMDFGEGPHIMDEVCVKIKTHIEGLMDQINKLESPPVGLCGHRPEDCTC